MTGPVVCLLPVRDGAEDLPGYLASVERFADAVVALDDGSSDETPALLAASPLVATVLSNPRRSGPDGWDDAANRNRLLAAAAELEPSWILSLDADERIDEGDGLALRRFIETEAVPGFAFGFRVYRMWGDLEHHEAAGYWVYRLFAFERGQRFPDQRLHFDPVPTAIPSTRHLRTTIRIQHLTGLTPERRAARRAKYAAADPEQAYGYRYPDATEEPAEVRRWEPRPPDLPVLVLADDGAAPGPALSAVVISRDDEAVIERTVRSVVEQETAWPFEVIVVTSGRDATAEVVRSRFPQVTLVELPEPALPGEARNAGLRVARGDYVSFPGSHVELPPGSLAARIAAHDLGYAMVTGSTLNGTDTPAGWAAYFLDHSSVLPGRPSAELPGPPAHCSYVRAALLEVGGFPEHLRAGEDTVVNNRLAALGHTAYRAREAHLVHRTPCRTRARLVRHYFVRGRSYGRMLVDGHRTTGRLLRRRSPRRLYRLQVRDRVAAIARHVDAWGDVAERARHRRVRRLVALGAAAHWLGTLFELAQPRRAAPLLLWGRPVVTLAVLDAATGERFALFRADAVARRAKLVRVPPELAVDVDGRLTAAPEARPAELLSRRASVRAAAPLSVRLTLLWAGRVVRPHHLHAVAPAWSGEDDAAARVARYLDTRTRPERMPPVAAAPRRLRPLFPAPARLSAERGAAR